MRSVALVASLFLVTAFAIPASAERGSRLLADFATIDDGEGRARLLVNFDPAIAAEHYVIGRAIIRFDLGGEAESRAVSLNVHPVTASWNPGSVSWTSGWHTPGGDFDERMMATSEIQLSRGAHSVSLDVTSALKETLESGEPWYGLIVTCDPRDGEGIASDDVSRFAGLENATVELTWRRVPPKPRELAEAPGGE